MPSFTGEACRVILQANRPAYESNENECILCISAIVRMIVTSRPPPPTDQASRSERTRTGHGRIGRTRWTGHGQDMHGFLLCLFCLFCLLCLLSLLPLLSSLFLLSLLSILSRSRSSSGSSNSSKQQQLAMAVSVNRRRLNRRCQIWATDPIERASNTCIGSMRSLPRRQHPPDCHARSPLASSEASYTRPTQAPPTPTQ